jgi:hypothetical protein
LKYKIDLDANLLADLVAEQLENVVLEELFGKHYKELKNRM